METEELLFTFKRRESPALSATVLLGIQYAKRDVTLMCEGMPVRAHRAVLAAYSSFFKEKFAADPHRDTLVMPSDVSYVALTRLLDVIYRGEVTVRDHQLYDMFKAVDTLKVDGLCTLVPDKQMKKMSVRSCVRCQGCQRAPCKGREVPKKTWTSRTSGEEGDSLTDQPSTPALAVVPCEAKENARNSSLKFASVNDILESPSQMSHACAAQRNAATVQSSYFITEATGYNGKVEAQQSSPELFAANASSVASTSKHTYATATSSSDATSSKSFDPNVSGSNFQAALYKVPGLRKIAKDTEARHPVKNGQVVHAVTEAQSTSAEAGDSVLRWIDAGFQESAPGPHCVLFPPPETPSYFGADSYRPPSSPTETRKRTHSAIKGRKTSSEERAEVASRSGPVRKSKAARLEKQ